MYLNFIEEKDVLIVQMNGELDHHSAEEVRISIDERLERTNIKNLIMDFSNVTFMDSSGIGAVIGRYKKLSIKKGAVSVVNARKPVKRVFELAGMFRIIQYYERLEDALSNFIGGDKNVR